MANSNRLVTEHLENVSWKILEDYPEIIKGMIRRRAGVYALYKGEDLYYVGLAGNLMGRLKTHLKDRHRGAWDRFSVYLTMRDEHIKELESLLLRIVNPIGNKQTGRFVKAHNLYAGLNKLITGYDADRRAKLLGGWVEKRRQRIKAGKAKGKGALKGLVDRRLTLKGWKDGWEYTASLRKDGTIRYGDEIFDTPNASAKVALGKSIGGWSFWHYKDKDGEWVRLKTLKRRN
jgi:hypothetical protein